VIFAYSGDHTFQPVPVAISIVSNAYAELQGTVNQLEALGTIKDNVTKFDDLSCGSINSSLGRFCGSEIIETLKKLRIKV
jgi:2,3-bisphosphoglycerate-independent phosphoglycerate mutase